MEHIKIIIDTQGGDQDAAVLIRGAADALEKFPALSVVLAGDEALIRSQWEALEMPFDRMQILHAPGVITNHDDPAQAIYHKTDSSMLMALQALAARDDLFGMLTAGNTAVLLTGTARYLSGPERTRPALAAVLPAQNGSFTCLVDTGATVDCSAPMLHHFARLGTDFMKKMYGISAPRVGLLSNGTEPGKGNRLVKETYPLLAADPTLNFVGNVEGSTALSGCCDVLVCDGFAGNQVMKVTEGTAKRLLIDIMQYAYRTENDDIKNLGLQLMNVYDLGSLGGGNILGAAKPVIKTRGNAGAAAVVNTAEMLINMAQNKSVFDTARNHI